MPEKQLPPEIVREFSLDGQSLDQHPLPVVVFGDHTRILYANPQGADLLGYSLPELVHLRGFDISPDLNISNWESQLDDSVRSTIHFRRKNWELFQVKTRCRQLWADQQLLRILAWEEVTEDLGGDAALKAFHHDAAEPEKLARMSHFTIQRASEAIYWIKSSGQITHVNEAACRKLGYSRAELTGMTLFDINPSITPENWAQVFVNLREQGSLLTETEHHPRTGAPIPIEVSSNYIYFEGTEYTCSIARDISDRKRKEAALRGAFTEIQELRARLEAENNYLQEEINLHQNFGGVVTVNPVMRQLMREIAQVAPTSTTVLIQGESGTGKELIARELHQYSPRSERPMIKLNCAALPSHLIESELFGHERGSFAGATHRKAGRFELADQGTILLDEIGEMPLEVQAKLLHVLQDGQFERLGGRETLSVDVRVIATSHRNLEKEVAQGNFRDDLFYRLNVFPLTVPPLRDRKEDIPPLVRHFCQVMESRIGKKIDLIPPSVLKRLQTYHFPGNVRELENIIERAVILSRNGKLQLGDWLPQSRSRTTKNSIQTLEAVNRAHIVKALQATKWRVSGKAGAASLLGLKPTTLESRMKKLGIQRSTAVMEQ